MQANCDSPTEQAIGLGRGIEGIARQLLDRKTDLLSSLGIGSKPWQAPGRQPFVFRLRTYLAASWPPASRTMPCAIDQQDRSPPSDGHGRGVRASVSMGEAKWRIKRNQRAALDVLYKMAVPDRRWVADLLGMPADEGFVIVRAPGQCGGCCRRPI